MRGPRILPAFDAVALRQRPRAVLEDRDLHAGGDAEVQIELVAEILPVAMAVDEARQHVLALGVDDLRAGRDRDLALAADGA